MPLSRIPRRRVVWLGGALALLPVALLALVQYQLIGRLRDTSVESRLMAAEDLAVAIRDRVTAHLSLRTDALLDLTREELGDDAAVMARFTRHRFPGAREAFIVRMDGAKPRVFFFDPAARRLVERPDAEAMDAIDMAMFPWLHPSRRSTLRRPLPADLMLPPTKLARINVDVVMADRRNRLVIHPVGLLDKFGGVSGYIIDHEWVVTQLVPRMIPPSLAAAGEKVKGFRVAVYQGGTGRAVYGRPARNGEAPMVRAGLRYGMSDFVVEIYEDAPSAAALASRGFALNMVLLALIVLLALAGLILTLRAARAEMALAAMKEDFVSTVTHELRTPLASIRLFGRLIRTGTVANFEETRSFGAHIEEESGRLTTMVEGILELARMEGRDWRPTFEEVELADVVRDAMQLHELRLRDEGFSVSCKLATEPLHVHGNRESLVGAVSNLIENAINYSTGVKAIDIELRAGSEAELSVRDRGIGISVSDASRIYERFYRADSDAVRAVKGAGLGLAMVRATVETHGGTITLQGRPGAGSTFTIHLARLRSLTLVEDAREAG
jgi:signal transduction histidine kinase